jgi:pSer/pThr/pTyr-binding forkhead associated (FHA) protein
MFGRTLTVRYASHHILVNSCITLVYIEYSGVRYCLAEINIPTEGNYILLENLINEKGSSSRMVNVVIPQEGKEVFKLGRGHEADIRINDISVSRFHAQLKCGKDGYYIEDNNSKFGTLAMVPNVEVAPNLIRAVQVGRTIVHLSVKPTELLM